MCMASSHRIASCHVVVCSWGVLLPLDRQPVVSGSNPLDIGIVVHFNELLIESSGFRESKATVFVEYHGQGPVL